MVIEELLVGSALLTSSSSLRTALHSHPLGHRDGSLETMYCYLILPLRTHWLAVVEHQNQSEPIRAPPCSCDPQGDISVEVHVYENDINLVTGIQALSSKCSRENWLAKTAKWKAFVERSGNHLQSNPVFWAPYGI